MSVPYQRAAVVVVDTGELLCVQLRDPVTRELILGPPGGGIEPGERPADTAIREVLEETGYRVTLDNTREVSLDYPYTWAGRTHDVRCHLFRGFLMGSRDEREDFAPDPIQEGVIWLPMSAVRPALEYLAGFGDAVLELAQDPPR
ncbi:MAG: NUDIX hydrolase [Myxococcales bacterium]|nr:NUDIX hydrolase [Myxococcales bacterium]